MSVDVCKACGGNAKELYPIGKKFLGINIAQLICNILQVNSQPTFRNSLICSSCITALHLVNEKIQNLRRAFLPSVQEVHSTFGCSTPNKTNSDNSKPVPEIRQLRASGNVATPMKPGPSNKNAPPKSSSKKTLNAKSSAETVPEIVVAKKTPAAKKVIATSKEKNQDKIVSQAGVESSLLSEAKDEDNSSTRLPEESEKQDKKIPKRRNTIYHFDCEFCDFQTGIIKAMQQHLIDVHDVKGPRIFVCKECSTKYTTKQGLDVHNKRHHPENDVETEKNEPSEDVGEKGEIKTTKETEPVKKRDSANSPVKQATPNVRSSPQKMKTPSDIKKGLNFNSSNDIVSPQKPSPILKPVSKKIYRCDECPQVYDSTFTLDLHRSLNHCQIANQSEYESVQQSDHDGDDDYTETTRGISNGLNGQNHNEEEVPETDSDLDNEQQVISSPKKSPVKSSKASISPTRVTGLSSVSPPKGKSNFNTKCEFCAYIFDSPKNYANHLTNKHGIEEPRVFKCIHCNKTYKTQAVLRRHIKNVHEKTKVDDVIASDYENDNNESNDDVEVSCFEATQTVQNHDDNASNSSTEFPFQIAKINALPIRTSLDQERANEAPRNRNITCPQCDQELDSMSALKKHLKAKHSDSDEAIYVCDLCPAKYKHKKNLKKHKQKQHSSNANEDLATDTDHLMVSEEDYGSQQKKTKVATPIKNNSFNADDTEAETSSLKKRKRKDSKSEGNLEKAHKKIKHSVSFVDDHLAELNSNPHPLEITCSECYKSFKSKEKLERHNIKHHTANQLELFACSIGSCQKQFKEQLYLDYHIKKKHPGVAF